MQIQKRSIYNAIRLHWLRDPEMEVQEWQVADYRSFSSDDLFHALEYFNLYLGRDVFIAFADDCDSPETLARLFAEDHAKTEEDCDYLYLVVFELWRRFLPEKRTLSICCDELDHQIQFYDQGKDAHSEELTDSIETLKLILDENVDEGIDPKEIFQTISEGLANNLESFLYDFIAEQLDEENFPYAEELIDQFNEFVDDEKWFAFLKARLLAHSDTDEMNQRIAHILETAEEEEDLEFNLEVLAFLMQEGAETVFLETVEKTLPLLESEGDFKELLDTCSQYFHFLDSDDREIEVKNILLSREGISTDDLISPDDPDLDRLQKIFKS